MIKCPRALVHPFSRARNEVQFAIADFVASVPVELSFLEEALRDSTYILQLEDGWNEEGAPSFKYATWEKAANFLVE